MKKRRRKRRWKHKKGEQRHTTLKSARRALAKNALAIEATYRGTPSGRRSQYRRKVTRA